MISKGRLSSGLMLPDPITDVGFGRLFFQILSEKLPLLVPSRYGTAEPLKKKFDASSIEEILKQCWGKHFYWINDKSKIKGIWSLVSQPKPTRHSTLFVYGEVDTFDPTNLIDVYRTLSSASQIDFGYIHEITTLEETYLFQNAYESHENYNSGVVTFSLKKGLPELPWAFLLGKPYVEMFGLDRLLNLPVHTVERWSSELVYIQLTAHLCDIENNYVMFSDLRKRVQDVLGTKYFASRNDSPIVPEYFDSGA